jgi:hypothetical protein
VSSPSQRIKKALKDTNSTIKKAIVKSTKQRRFWFLIGTTLGFILPTLLFAPKLLHATGVTETDLMDDFLTASLLPFLNERAGAFTDRLNDSNAGPRPGEVLAGDGAKRKHPVFLGECRGQGRGGGGGSAQERRIEEVASRTRCCPRSIHRFPTSSD